jgi:hypothetical protein
VLPQYSFRNSWSINHLNIYVMQISKKSAYSVVAVKVEFNAVELMLLTDLAVALENMNFEGLSSEQCLQILNAAALLENIVAEANVPSMGESRSSLFTLSPAAIKAADKRSALNVWNMWAENEEDESNPEYDEDAEEQSTGPVDHNGHFGGSVSGPSTTKKVHDHVKYEDKDDFWPS